MATGFNFEGKAVLLTGSSEGIGLATARKLLECGALVTVNGRNDEKLAAAVAGLGSGAQGIAADLGTAQGCADLARKCGNVDIFIGNLGIAERDDFLVADDMLWDRHWQVNVMANVRLARAFLPYMRGSNWGRILLISSEFAFNIPVDMIHYGVSKTAVCALARGLAKSVAGTGITVNSVLAGPTMTDSVEQIVREAMAPGQSFDEAATEILQKFRPGTLLKRASSPDEVANMIVYLASPLASATTGAAIRVDGGVIDALM